MWGHVVQDAYPTHHAFNMYTRLMIFQLTLAFVTPGYIQGLPIPLLNYKTLQYNCNAISSFYVTLVTCAALHWTGIFGLTEIVDNFGELMTVAMIYGFVVGFAVHFITIVCGEQMRMGGNFMDDFFMGACPNPRIVGVDLKMWAKVHIPWVLLFLIAVSGGCKQYDTYGYVTPNIAFMILATGLYINVRAKGEECIP
ncbi:C-24(28) sterol reductase [Ceratobasidium sp. UAMH 11750]|nr:C-24(28) sterol reductase [Ceratobasidium sp. UAMH 11750]